VLALNANPSGWNIVVAGHWNRAIFNPEWIIGRLTQDKHVGMEIQITGSDPPIRITFENLALMVTASRLQVNVMRCEDKLMQRALEVVKQVLSDLIHTPVSAVGINFRFECGWWHGGPKHLDRTLLENE